MRITILIAAAIAAALAVQAQSQFLGAVPDAQASSDAVSLSLSEAIRLGLKNNLGTLLADENSRVSRGERVRAMAALLPRMYSRVTQESEQINLAAFGFTPPAGTPNVVGPFGLFDARAHLSQTIVDFRSRINLKASDETIRASSMEYKDARDTVVLAVTHLYLAATAGESRIAAAKARVSAAKALYDQAVSFKQTGIVAGIEALRAEVQLRGQKQRLIAYQNEFEKQKLHLAWAIGVDAGASLHLTDPMPAAGSGTLPKLEQAMAMTLESRMDYRGLQSRIKAAELSRRAVSSGRIPTVAFNGDYGVIGKSAASNHGTYSAAIALTIPLFDGNRIIGDEIEADAVLNRLRAQSAELRARIQFELRSAYLDLQAATEQLEVAHSTVELARLQEVQARDRFAAGIANNLEVVQAQEALAQADENLISSLLASNLAKAALARSVGSTERNVPLFLLGAK